MTFSLSFVKFSKLNLSAFGGSPIPWCRVASDSLTANDVVRFPFAILEVKLAGIEENPDWVQEMLDSCGVTQVFFFYRFWKMFNAMSSFL